MRAVLLAVVLVAACGDVVKHTDGGMGDDDAGSGSADAPPPAPITIHVRTFGGVPDLAANVLVMTDGGDVVFDSLVDATGSVTVDMPSTGWVTSRSVSTSGTTKSVAMTTIRGVEPGDELFLGPPKRPEDSTTVNANRSIQFTRYASTASHTFYVPCGNRFFATTDTSTTGTVPINDDCVPQTFSLLGIATLGNQQVFSFVPNQTRGASTAIVVPTPWTNMSTVAAAFTNVPSGMEYFSATRYTLLDGVSTVQASAGASNPPASVNLSLPYAPNVGSGARYSVAFGNQTTGERQWLAIRTASITSTIAFDYSMLDLPRLLSIPAQTTEGATWTETAGTFNADLRIVRWTGHFTAGNDNTDITWNIVDNEHGGSITLPTLPASYAAFDPRKLAGFRDAGDNQVFYVNCDMLADYKSARPLNLNLINTTLDFKGQLGDSYRCRSTESSYNDAIP